MKKEKTKYEKLKERGLNNRYIAVTGVVMVTVIFISSFWEAVRKFNRTPADVDKENIVVIDNSVISKHHDSEVVVNENKFESEIKHLPEVGSVKNQKKLDFRWVGLKTDALIKEIEAQTPLKHNYNSSFEIGIFLDYDLAPYLDSETLYKCYKANVVIKVNSLECGPNIELKLDGAVTGNSSVIGNVLEKEAEKYIDGHSISLVQQLKTCIN